MDYVDYICYIYVDHVDIYFQVYTFDIKKQIHSFVKKLKPRMRNRK